LFLLLGQLFLRQRHGNPPGEWLDTPLTTHSSPASAIFAWLMVYRKFSGSVALSESLPVTLTGSRVYPRVWPGGRSTNTIAVISGISQYQQPTGNSMNMNEATSGSSPNGCMYPVRATCLPSRSRRYFGNVGLNDRPTVVSVSTGHGNGVTPCGSIG